MMAALISNIPHVVLAETGAPMMIPTALVVDEMSRAETQTKIETLLGRTEIHVKLAELGLSQDEISKRLSTLSDSEVRQMATQLEEARYGGEITSILVIVVLVLLIIYLAKRI